MVGRLILWGLLVGVAAGLLAFGWARAFGEGPVDAAIGFESAQNEARAAAARAAGQQPEEEEPEIFTRTVQSGIGLLTGLVAVGAGLGSLFAVLFALAYGRLGSLKAGPTAGLLALLGLVSVYLVPFLKYPANPPSVGDHGTIKLRTGLYFLMVALSVTATVMAVIIRRRLIPRHGAWYSSVAAAGVYLVVMTVIFAFMPGINEVPENFPATTLWDFRVASIGMEIVLWGSIGVMFGYVGERTLRHPH